MEQERRIKENELWLQPWRATDPRVLLGLAFKLMGENAQKIGTLSITPELLGGLLRDESPRGLPMPIDRIVLVTKKTPLEE